MNKLPKSVAVIVRRYTGDIFTEKSSFEKIFNIFESFKNSEDIYDG